MQFDLSKHATDEVLSTAPLGKKVFAEFISQTPSATAPMLVFLNFRGVSTATTSFLREAVVTFRAYAREHLTDIYPVPVNLVADVKEELGLYLRDRGDAMAICELDNEGQASGAEVIGQLDGKLLSTLKAVVAIGETDATTLAQRFAHEDNVGTTTWNNRLATLASKGLLVETSHGRAKRYRAVLEGLAYGR